MRLNEGITWKEIYDNVADKSNVSFVAKREDIQFENVEEGFPHLNFNCAFALDTIVIPGIRELFTHEAIGMVRLEPFQKIRMLAKLLDGIVYYEKIEGGREWKVNIIFRQPF
jgi:hypothetical protein